MNTKSERDRLIIDTQEIVRRAIHLRKIKQANGETMSTIVTNVLRKEFAEEIQELEAMERKSSK